MTVECANTPSPLTSLQIGGGGAEAGQWGSGRVHPPDIYIGTNQKIIIERQRWRIQVKVLVPGVHPKESVGPEHPRASAYIS